MGQMYPAGHSCERPLAEPAAQYRPGSHGPHPPPDKPDSVQLSGVFAVYPASHDWSHVMLNGSVAEHVPELPFIGAASDFTHGNWPHAGYWVRSTGPQPSLIMRFSDGVQL